MQKNKFYITTPIYYVNSKPHLGTLYSTLLADVFARFNKLEGKEVFFLTGTDEHGQKIAQKATEKNLDPQSFADTIIPEFKSVWKKYELSYDKFIRTTDAEHIKSVQYWIEKLLAQGDIYKSSYKGLYCVPCETFITSKQFESEVEKVCPSCKRGLEEIIEENYFFRLSAYQDRLLEFYSNNPDFIIPKERLNEVISFVKSGLEDLSISRAGVKWGIPFPADPSQTVYVWADALNNYISAIGYGSKDKAAQGTFDFWWPADMQVMAKDILRFHAVYWPAFLMAASLPMPKKLLVHGYILMGHEKMSKSKGNIVEPLELAEKYGVEQVRYYLMRQISVNQDGHFDISDLESRINSDLANTLGNLLHRMLLLSINNGVSEVISPDTYEAVSESLRIRCEEGFRGYWDNMNHGQIHIALSDLWKFISEVNAYFNNLEPWKVIKTNKEFFKEIIAATSNSLYSIAIMVWPIMPKKAEEILLHLGLNFNIGENIIEELRENKWNKKFKLSKPSKPLFEKIEMKEEKMENSKSEAKQIESNNISIEDLAKVDLRVGTILSCENVPGSDKLFKLEVDFGDLGVRQILSGVRQNFSQNDLINKQCIAVVNLPPRKMVGLVSEGMILYASDDKGNFRLITSLGNVENGTRLR